MGRLQRRSAGDSAARKRAGRRTARTGARRSSLEKMIGILDLFEEEHLRWTPEQMMARLACPRSTLYRYLRVLANAGLITSLPDVGYALGPRIAELDYRMRSSDPLISNGRPLLEALAKEIPGIGLLCRYYRGCVLCVHQQAGANGIRSSYERGRAMPIARGAASRVILAYLKPAHLRQLFESQAREFSRVGMGRSFAKVQEHLRQIRRQGHCVTRGEVTPGVIGIAAPVLDSEAAVIGSLSITVPESGANTRRLRSITDRVAFSAQVLTNSMRRGQAGVP
ncbi:MAG: IclR family transcriptional regulator [Betaproteobacteria bacterium]|nr:IclR family transcriptional regulator [Betaproteobacteria bacterium]